MTANRVTGLAIALFALALVLFVIPAHTETVASGWLKPDTLPLACGVALLALGLLQAALPGRADTPDSGHPARFALALAATAGAGWVMLRGGFLAGSVPLMAGMMVLTGERRPLLIGVASLAIPCGLWLVVDVLLSRPLP